MTVRPAKFQDIPRLCALMEEAHAASKYAAYPLDIKNRFKPLVMESIRSGNQCVFVSETGDMVEGFIIGMVDDLYHVLKVKYATDVLFWVSERDNSRNFIRLFDAFVGWASDIRGVVSIRVGVTNAVGETAPVENLYEKRGMRREGAMFEMEVPK